LGDITVFGNLNQVSIRLKRISEVVKNREALGFPVFQGDEELEYLFSDDDRLCPVCRRFGEERFFTGLEVQQTFSHISRVGEYKFAPNVHETHPELMGECRCRLILLHPAETFEERLYEEKLAVL